MNTSRLPLQRQRVHLPCHLTQDRDHDPTFFPRGDLFLVMDNAMLPP